MLIDVPLGCCMGIRESVRSDFESLLSFIVCF